VVGGHERCLALSPHRVATNRAGQPSRARQRDVAADQGDAGTCGGWRRRHHPCCGANRRRDLRPAAAVSDRGGAVRADRVCPGLLAALDRAAPDHGRGGRMIRDFGIVWSERDLLLSGLANTTILSLLSAAAALLIGSTLTPALMAKQRWLVLLARGFV